MSTNQTEAVASNAELGPLTAEECARIISSIRYMQGIAERGEGRPIRDDETVEDFVLGYVKKLEERAESDALRKDAERYRWLKHNPQWLGWEHDFRPDEVEREIDAAMADKQAVGAA